ncbi:MAG: hypothetical protein LUC97_10645 [Clostridiales bacterium]|nr:hypothetical protein [Clostridiales bacterium]
MMFEQKYRQYYKTVIEEHKAVFEAQNTDELQAFITDIAGADRVFIVGAGREGIAARSFAMRIMHMGKETHWLWDDTTPGMKEGDLFIAVNGSGKIGHIDYLINQALSTGQM